MSRPPTKRSIKAKIHKAWADRIKARDGHLCQLCRKPHRVLNAHHLLPKSVYPQYQYELWNGICLDFRCHKVDRKSPHLDPFGFIKFMKIYKADQYDRIMEELDSMDNPLEKDETPQNKAEKCLPGPIQQGEEV